MRILHLLSQTHLTGAEVYALDLCESQIADGYECFIISDTLATETRAQFTQMPIHNRAYPNRVRNILQLIAFSKSHQIDLIHAHSRAASWLAYWVTRKLHIGYVSTVHGRQGVHFSSKRKNIYGHWIIAVCEEIRDHLIQELHIPSKYIFLIRNGLCVNVAAYSGKHPIVKNIAWIGRLTGPKGMLLKDLLENVFNQFPDLNFTVVGGPNERVAIFVQYATSNVHFMGQVKKVDEIISNHDLILGSGRVALEAMRRHKPVLAIGEKYYIGLIDSSTINIAKATNFGDCARNKNISLKKVGADLQRIVHSPKTYQVKNYSKFLQDYDKKHVYKKVSHIYRQAIIDAYLRQYKEIPVLMYHQVVVNPIKSKYQIFVIKNQLDGHLKSLRKRGYESLTFKDIYTGKRVKRPVILTFDDGYLNNYEFLLPLLKKYHMKAVIFVLGNRNLKTNVWDSLNGEQVFKLMSDKHIRAMHESGLVEIGSHGLNHSHLMNMDDAGLEREISDSKAFIENIIQSSVISFSYPYGEYGDREKKAVDKAGYFFGIGTVNGPLHLIDDLKAIRRIQIFPKDKGFEFWKKTSGWYLRYCKLKGKDF